MTVDQDRAGSVSKFEFDPGGFMLCHEKKFMFVVIAKNATTTLKRLVYSLDFPEHPALDDNEALHEFLGYRFDGTRRVPIAEAAAWRAAGYVSFAVYRDPVERFLSLYRDKVAPDRPDRMVRRYFAAHGMIGATTESFIRFASLELAKRDPLDQDEHLRRQVSFYRAGDVDFIVPIELLSAFLQQRFAIDAGTRLNRSTVGAQHARLNADLEHQLRALYAADYVLPNAANLYTASESETKTGQ